MRLMVLLISLVAAVAAADQQSSGTFPVPQLDLEAPPDLAPARMRLESFDPARLRGVMSLAGLDQPGPAIRVVLASDTSDWARQVPSTTAGFAVGEDSLVVLFPSRSPVYPNDTLEDVLHHEVAHVLIARASGGTPLPLWFNEGLAMAAEHTWGLEDEARLVGTLTMVARTNLEDVNALFTQNDESDRARAYTLAAAFIRDLIRYHGASAPGELLKAMRAGASFEKAFVQVIGLSVADAEAAFWNRQRFWTTWVPFLTTSTTLWMIVTLLALLAIYRRRQKSAALRKGWDEEGLD